MVRLQNNRYYTFHTTLQLTQRGKWSTIRPSPQKTEIIYDNIRRHATAEFMH